jgi:hypothetical protein
MVILDGGSRPSFDPLYGNRSVKIGPFKRRSGINLMLTGVRRFDSCNGERGWVEPIGRGDGNTKGVTGAGLSFLVCQFYASSD